MLKSTSASFIVLALLSCSLFSSASSFAFEKSDICGERENDLIHSMLFQYSKSKSSDKYDVHTPPKLNRFNRALKRANLNCHYENGTAFLPLFTMLTSSYEGDGCQTCRVPGEMKETFIESLINAGSSLENQRILNSELYFKFASSSLTEFILSKNYPVNYADSLGRTPLYYAVASGNLELVKVILSHGADVTLKDNDGCTPMHIVANSPTSVEILKLLLQSNSSKELLSTECYIKDSDFSSGYTSGTPLMIAIKKLVSVARYAGSENYDEPTNFDAIYASFINVLIDTYSKLFPKSIFDGVLQMLSSARYGDFREYVGSTTYINVVIKGTFNKLLDLGVDTKGKNEIGQTVILAAQSLEDIQFLLNKGVPLFNSKEDLFDWKTQLKLSPIFRQSSARASMYQGAIVLGTESHYDGQDPTGDSTKLGSTALGKISFDSKLSKWTANFYPRSFCPGFVNETRILGQWKGGYLAWCGSSDPVSTEEMAKFWSGLVLLDQDFKTVKTFDVKTSIVNVRQSGYFNGFFKNYGDLISSKLDPNRYFDGPQIQDFEIGVKIQRKDGSLFQLRWDGEVQQ